MKYYKALTKDWKSFYDGTTWSGKGNPRPIEDADRDGSCGKGYHLAKSPAAAIKYARFPFRLFEVKPLSDILGEDADKIRVASAKIVRPLPMPKWVYSVEQLIRSIQNMKWFSQSLPVKKSWRVFDSRDAAWTVARDAVTNAAWNAAKDAAWTAAREAERDSARDAAWTAAWTAVRDAMSNAAWETAWETAWEASKAAMSDPAWTAAWKTAKAAMSDATRDAAWDVYLMLSVTTVPDLSIDPKYTNHAKERWDVWQRGYGLLCDVDEVLYVYRKP